LTKLAKASGGIVGLNVDTSRSAEKKPRVGDVFIVQDTWTNWKEFIKKYDLKPEDIEPADYTDEIKYLTPEQLIELGLGKAIKGPGTEKASKKISDEL
jgi:hypothetical protein